MLFFALVLVRGLIKFGTKKEGRTKKRKNVLQKNKKKFLKNTIFITILYYFPLFY